MATLRPRARIIRTIGDQLISGPEAAVIELVKNAYDADAKSVLIRLIPPSENSPNGEIAVVDNGHGMTYQDVLSRWFEPATDEKIKRTRSPGGRRLLGAKGIGRFAASRLGSATTLRCWAISGTRLEETTVQVNWEDFSADKYLDAVDIPVTKKTKAHDSKSVTGVEITIKGLRDVWSKSKLERLIKELRRVASPSLTEGSFVIHLDVTELTKESAGFDGMELLSQLNFDYGAPEAEQKDPTAIIPFRVYEHADYSLDGAFDQSGMFSGIFTNHRGDGVPQTLEVPAPPINPDQLTCGPCVVRINVYDRENDAIENLFRRMNINFDEIGIRAARKILTDNSGIAMFREGFRIRPYGEPENDWLELERQRVQYPSKKLGISQVSGRVDIGSEEESNLIERSSREGLEHNGAFDRLIKLIQSVLTHIEDRRLDFRERAGLSRKASGDLSATKSLANLPEIRKEALKAPSPYKARLERAIEKDSAALSVSLEELDTYQKLLQSRAALGLVVAQVIHEARRILNPLAEAARVLNEDSTRLLEQTKLGDLARKHLPDNLRIISTGTRELSRLIKRLDPISGRRRGAPRDFDIKETISRSIKLFEEQINAQAISVDMSALSHIRAYGYPEDLQSATMNIIENAIHWLGSTEADEKGIAIASRKNKKVATISISNTGPAIDESYVPRLFQAGFSLRSEGTGLGLAIAREACRGSKGDLTYDDNQADTTFVITLPASKDS